MRVLVIGSGDTVRDDLAQVDRSDFDLVIGVNAAALEFGPVDVHVSLHPEKYAEVKAAYMVANRPYKGVDAHMQSRWFMDGDSGSSGLFAVKYAIQKRGATYVLLAGVPMDVAPHFNRPEDWEAAKIFQKTWLRVLPQIKGTVFSLSGWTAELLNGLDQPNVAGVSR